MPRVECHSISKFKRASKLFSPYLKLLSKKANVHKMWIFLRCPMKFVDIDGDNDAPDQNYEDNLDNTDENIS